MLVVLIIIDITIDVLYVRGLPRTVEQIAGDFKGADAAFSKLCIRSPYARRTDCVPSGASSV